MIRLRNAALALATGLLAAGAVAQDAHFLQDSEGTTVAHELFGGAAVELEFDDFDADEPTTGFEPKAKLIFDGSATISAGTEFSVTYRLANATFAESVSFRDFMWGRWAPDADGADDAAADDGDDTNGMETADNCQRLEFTQLSAEVEVDREGGAKGGDSVTFNVKVLGVDADADGDLDDPVASIAGLAYTPDKGKIAADRSSCAASTAADAVDGYTNEGSTTRKIVFVLPDVNASGLRAPNHFFTGDPGASVVVNSMIEQTKSTGTPIMEAVGMGHMCGTGAAVAANGAPAKAPGTGGCAVVSAAKVITSITAEGGSGMISLAPADSRAVLVKADGKHEDPQRAMLAKVTVAVDAASGARDKEGDMITDLTGDLAGVLAIKVSSEGFNDGDVVYIDDNGNKKVDGREEFEMDEGTALDTVPLEGGSYTVYYVPNGKDALKHRTMFTTTANTEFAEVDNRTVSAPKAGSATLTLHGIKPGTAKAYAIAPLTSTDVANVRVTCETSAKAGCNVFLDCRDAMGTATFGEAGAMVGPNMTVRWNQMQIAEALGLDDGWEGRMACEVLSSAPITVQVLTRAAGVLVNNTATVSGGI